MSRSSSSSMTTVTWKSETSRYIRKQLNAEVSTARKSYKSTLSASTSTTTTLPAVPSYACWTTNNRAKAEALRSAIVAVSSLVQNMYLQCASTDECSDSEFWPGESGLDVWPEIGALQDAAIVFWQETLLWAQAPSGEDSCAQAPSVADFFVDFNTKYKEMEFAFTVLNDACDKDRNTSTSSKSWHCAGSTFQDDLSDTIDAYPEINTKFGELQTSLNDIIVDVIIT